MQTAEQISVLDKKYPQLKNIQEVRTSALKKVQTEAKRTLSSFALLKRFIKEMQLHNDDFLRMYNREVI